MHSMDNLEKKIKMAAEQLKSFKIESEKLQKEVAFLREENAKLKDLSQDGASWTSEKRQISNKIERILKKINSLGAIQ
jgi:regulator of replication initiation timing